jgi:hypothetical protein
MIRPLTRYSQNVDRMPHPPQISKSPLKTARPVTIAAGTNEVAMWALQLYIGLFPNFHSPFREPKVSIFQTVFSHEISIPPPTSQLSLGHFSSGAPGVPFFISWSGMHVHCHIYLIHAHIFDSLQILFTFGYLFLICAGTFSSALGITPSGIYSALACSLSRCIALAFPVTPSDVYL